MTRWLGVLAVLALLAAGCAGEQEEAAPGPTSQTASGTAGETVAEHCAKVTRVDSDAPVSLLNDGTIELPGADVEAAEPTGTVLVLLHQTGSLGLCGWSDFAGDAADAGLSSVAIDMCGYAAATTCPEDTPAEQQVALAVDHARTGLGATTVVLVGASMGGSQTVTAVARGADVDAWADLSGPAEWEGTTLLDLAPDVRARDLPGLVAHAADDDDQQYAAAQQLATATGATFLDAESGHGWEMLDDNQGALRPDGQQLLDFLASVG